jgi:hypothetical protein
MFFTIRKNIQKIIIVCGLAATLGVSASAFVPTIAQAAPVSTFAAAECTTDDCRKLYTKYINPAIRLLSAVVGVVVIVAIVVGGVQYSAAGSDPQKVAGAKSLIMKAVIGLVSFIFLFAFLQWFVPGGVY